MRILATVAVLTCLGVSACNSGACISGVGAPGITLSTRDSVSGVNLDELVVVTVMRLSPKLAPARSDSARGGIGAQVPVTSRPVSIADDLPGQYRVTVEAPGYRTWTEIVTVRGGCESVDTVEIVARLVPAP